MSAGLELRGWAGDSDGLPSVEQLARAYGRAKQPAAQSISISASGLAGRDLAALRQEVRWATDVGVLRRTVELLRARDGVDDWQARKAAVMAQPCDCDGLMRGTLAQVGPHAFDRCPCRWLGPLHSEHAYWHRIWFNPIGGVMS
jgi:hypothetical protein